MVNQFLERSLDAAFGALADPTRRAILARLARESTSVTALARGFPVSLPAISKHLRVLEKAGLLVQEREQDGRVRLCRLAPRPMQQAAGWLHEYRRFWETQFDNLDRYLRSANSGKEETCTLEQKSRTRKSRSGAPSRRRGKKSSARGRSASV